MSLVIAESGVRNASKHRHGPRIVISDPSKPKRSKPQPYVRGQYDSLLPFRDHLPQGEVRSCSIELSKSGESIIVTEVSVTGQSPRHLVSEYPHYVDIDLANGDSIQIEIRKLSPLDEISLNDLVRKSEVRSRSEVLLIGVAMRGYD